MTQSECQFATWHALVVSRQKMMQDIVPFFSYLTAEKAMQCIKGTMNLYDNFLRFVWGAFVGLYSCLVFGT